MDLSFTLLPLLVVRLPLQEALVSLGPTCLVENPAFWLSSLGASHGPHAAAQCGIPRQNTVSFGSPCPVCKYKGGQGPWHTPQHPQPATLSPPTSTHKGCKLPFEISFFPGFLTPAAIFNLVPVTTLFLSSNHCQSHR